MHPEVEEFFKTIEAADKAQNDALKAAEADYNKIYHDRQATNEQRDGAYRAYTQVQHAQDAITRATFDLAWAKLGLAENKLVAYMARHIPTNYRRGHAVPILKILPASLSQMREVAVKYDWCNEFERLMNEAVAAGVVDDERTKERQDLDRYLANVVNRRYIVEINTLVSKVLEAEAQSIVDARVTEQTRKAEEEEAKREARNAARRAQRAAAKQAEAQAETTAEPERAVVEPPAELVSF